MSWIDHTSDLFNDLSLTSDQQDRLDALIAAGQAAIEKFLKRTIESTEHDEVLPVLQDGALCLSNFPVLSVARICDSKQSVLTLSNSSAQLSSCYVTSTGLSLNRTSSGTRTSNTLAFATYKTVTTVAGAVTALGSGWSASATSGWESYPSTDLVEGQFLNTTSDVSLYLWKDASSRFSVDYERGLIRSGFGAGDVRVIYTAGFASVPDDLQKVLADLARDAYDDSVSVVAESLSDYSYSLASMSERMERLGLTNKGVLSAYKNRRI